MRAVHILFFSLMFDLVLLQFLFLRYLLVLLANYMSDLCINSTTDESYAQFLFYGSSCSIVFYKRVLTILLASTRDKGKDSIK
jgi:hypothetical protein